MEQDSVHNLDNGLDFDFGQQDACFETQQPVDAVVADEFDYSLLQGFEMQGQQPLIPHDFDDHMRPSDLDMSQPEVYSGQAVPDDLGPQYYNSYIPDYWLPDQKCRYCASMGMQCKVFRNGGNKACASCIYLFRPCSFVNSQDVGGGRIDLLHVVDEDMPQDVGLPTRMESLYTAGASHVDIHQDSAKANRRQQRTGRFSRDVLGLLRAWLRDHAEHPYPTEQEKLELGHETGLTRSQIANWLANARRRGKTRPTSEAQLARANPVPIPTTPNRQADQSHLTPFDRWKESPPEHEAPLNAIVRNAEATTLGHFGSGASSLSQSIDEMEHSSAVSNRQNRPGSSVTSWENPTSRSNDTRSQDSSSMMSHASSRSSYSAFAKKERRRRHRLSAKHATTPKKPSKRTDLHRPFQCTFCVDTFVTKHDWMRHEKSLHLNLEKWICAPQGACEHEASSNIIRCAYCGLKEPTPDHIVGHDHAGCTAKGEGSRTFLRKDHLRQHLRLVHNAPMSPHHDAWKLTPDIIRSRCGFCAAEFSTWDERAAHLAGHFRSGATMADWTGTWGFEPEVAACVQDALTPSAIEAERRKTQPAVETASEAGAVAGPSTAAPPPPALTGYEFGSKTPSTGNWDLASTPSTANDWDAVSGALVAFHAECQARGVPATDAMLQRAARQQVHGCSDTAGQRTSADDATWLKLFKQQAGLPSQSPEPLAGFGQFGASSSQGTSPGMGVRGGWYPDARDHGIDLVTGLSSLDAELLWEMEES